MIYLPFDFFSVTVQERWHRLSFMLAETSKGDAEDCTVFHLFLGTDTHLYWVIHTTSTASLYELHTGLSCVWGFNLWLSGSLKLLAQARSHQTKGWTCPWVMRWPSAWEGLTTVESIPLWFCTAATSIPQQNLLHWASGMPSRRLLLEPQGTLTSEQRGFWKKNERHGPERQVCRVSIWRPQRSVQASCLNSTQVREEPSLSKVSLKLCALGNQQRGWNVGNFPGSLSRHARNQWIDPAHL